MKWAVFQRSRFIKTGILDRELGRWVNKAFELRQRVDYREYFEVTRDQADDLLKNAEKFVSIVRGYVDTR